MSRPPTPNTLASWRCSPRRSPPSAPRHRPTPTRRAWSRAPPPSTASEPLLRRPAALPRPRAAQRMGRRREPPPGRVRRRRRVRHGRPGPAPQPGHRDPAPPGRRGGVALPHARRAGHGAAAERLLTVLVELAFAGTCGTASATRPGCMITGARDTGAPMLVLYALTRRAAGEIATGRWTTARAGMAEALQLADGTGQPGLAAMPLIGHAPSTRPGIPRRPCTTSNSSCSHHRLAALDRLEAAARAGRPETAADWVRGARRVRRDDRIYADRRRRRPRPRPARHRPCGRTALRDGAGPPRTISTARRRRPHPPGLRRAPAPRPPPRRRPHPPARRPRRVRRRRRRTLGRTSPPGAAGLRGYRPAP